MELHKIDFFVERYKRKMGAGRFPTVVAAAA
jgi:hypothetical protein